VARAAEPDTAQLSITEFRPGRSRETGGRPADTLHRAARAAYTRAHSVATIMAERPGAIRHAEARASVVAGVSTAAADLMAAGGADRGQ
jgi:hypothetical protein